MQRQESIDFSKFCGRDEDGDSKALCTLQVASVDIETNEIKEIDAVSVLNSEVAIDIGKDIVTIDVKFENHLDFEYLQAGELCLKYKEKHSNQEYDEDVTLLLTITECGEYANFLIGQEAMWAFTSEKPEDRNHMIRFWFLKDNFIIYRLSDQEIEKVVEQVGEEVYLEELGGSHAAIID